MSSAGETTGSILVVDDEPIVADSLADWLREDGHRVDTAHHPRQALELVARHAYDLAFIDLRMPGMDGLELQARLAASGEMAIVLMTAYSSVESAVAALKAGAYDYVTKPFDPEEMSLLARRALDHRRLRVENARLRRRLRQIAVPQPIIGRSAAIRKVLALIDSVAATDTTVLIKGESGTGKELVARAIHDRSARRYGPLVVVNCGALAEGILESELFGHQRGAFTGAHQARAGKFESADGGTIFLDEIAAVSPRVQVELLRVLEEKAVTRLGARAPVRVDFRVVSATNQSLERLVEDGGFREDLYWRLNVFPIEVPPLRLRREDIPLLAEHFLARFTRAMNKPEMRLSAAAAAALRDYAWPGNVRELQNALEQAVVIGRSSTVAIEDLPRRVTHAREARDPMTLAEVERRHLLAVLGRTDWNISRAARLLGIDRGTLYNRLERYGVERPGGDAPRRRRPRQ